MFWIFMLIMDLLIPVTMIGIGKKFSYEEPENINSSYGYRTAMSMKSKETWKFAHKYCGKIWFVCGWILLPISGAPFLFLVGKNEDIIGTLGGIICIVQMVVMTASILPHRNSVTKAFRQKWLQTVMP